MRLEWSEKARQGLFAILEYIGSQDVDAAQRVFDELENAAESLLRFPMLGQPGRIAGTRDLLVRPRFRLIYKISNETIFILAVLHTSQRFPEVREIL